MKTTRISAVISRTTKELLNQHVRATGVTRGRLLETALLYHRRALQELPADILVRPRLVVSRRSAREIWRRLGFAAPRPQLRDLMDGRDGS